MAFCLLQALCVLLHGLMAAVLFGIIMLRFSLQVLLARVRRHGLLFLATVWFSGLLTVPRGPHSDLSWGLVTVPLLNGWDVEA